MNLKDFPKVLKESVFSDDYQAHILELQMAGDVEEELTKKQAHYENDIQRFKTLGGKMDQEGQEMWFILGSTRIYLWFNTEMELIQFQQTVRFDVPKAAIVDYCEDVVISNAVVAMIFRNCPLAAIEKLNSIKKDIDNKHIVNGIDDLIRRIKETPTSLAQTLAGAKLRDDQA